MWVLGEYLIGGNITAIESCHSTSLHCVKILQESLQGKFVDNIWLVHNYIKKNPGFAILMYKKSTNYRDLGRYSILFLY